MILVGYPNGNVTYEEAEEIFDHDWWLDCETGLIYS